MRHAERRSEIEYVKLNALKVSHIRSSYWILEQNALKEALIWICGAQQVIPNFPNENWSFKRAVLTRFSHPPVLICVVLGIQLLETDYGLYIYIYTRMQKMCVVPIKTSIHSFIWM